MKNKKLKSPSFASNFWYDEPDFDSDVLSSEIVKSDTSRLYKLAASKRAISNFVRIVVPDKPIRTVFQGNQSYTDGNSVTIGANVDNISHFDSAVGLALHEAAHIKLSDFSILRDIGIRVEGLIGNEDWSSLVELSIKSGIEPYSIDTHLKGILNYVEDRRIDQYIYDTAPGYRDYYRALYDKYFNDSLITTSLKSDEYTDETLDSYMFRLINLHGEGSRLNALKGLTEIWKVLELGNISRLKSSTESLMIAIQIYTIILKNLDPQSSSSQNNSNESSQSESGESSSSQSGSDEESGEDSGSDEESSDDSGSNDSPASDDTGLDSNDSSTKSSTDDSSTKKGKSNKSKSGTPTLSNKQKGQLEKKIQKQKDFLDGKVSKTKMSNKDNRLISQIEESGSEMIEVGEGILGKTNCILIRKVTPEFAQTSAFPFHTNWDSYVERNREWIQKGIRMGKRLAGKLQLRSDSRSTEYNRLRSGKIDKRMLSLLGAGQSNVFFTKEVDSYNNGNLHISIDASSSMGGEPWNQAMMTTTALIKAIEEIPNLEVQVSVRGTQSLPGRSEDLPLIAIVYDSRVDKFSKVLKLFPHLVANGTTPEGLTFQAIMGEMIRSNGNLDSYFLNMSDGEPYFTNYGGEYARNHTKKQVQRIESMGIKVLSYFISSSDCRMNNFRQMYGQSAKRIDVQSISQIARTMNEMFLKK